MIATHNDKPSNTSKAEQAQRAFAQMLIDASRRGFHGTTSLVLSVQDGHIQHLRLSVEQVIK